MKQVPALFALLLATLVVACGDPEPGTRPAVDSSSASPPAATRPILSLAGAALPEPVIGESFRARQEELLRAARQRLEENADDPEAWIWVGRRIAYLGRYREAIDHYTAAIERFPDEARLYRHRGHRQLTIRQLDSAIEDLSRAAALVAGEPDRVEPDGLPNDRGIPTSTLQSNIWYHLGLAHYLRGDFARALEPYRECLAVSKNPDMRVATTYWLYLTLRRVGEAEEAAAALATITPELDVIENHDYHRLLLSYRRLADAHEMWKEAGADATSVRFATVAYGLGAWHLVEGRPDKAREWFTRALESPGWAAFGYLAAEAELARETP